MKFLDKWFPKTRAKLQLKTSGDESISTIKGKSVTKFEEKSLFAAKCPDCSGSLYEGPSGGIATNVACGDCGSEFNLVGIPGMTERLSTRGQPNINRLRDIYRITLSQNHDVR